MNVLISNENSVVELGSSVLYQVTVQRGFTVNLHFLLIIRDILTTFWPLPEVVASLRKKMQEKAPKRMKW